MLSNDRAIFIHNPKCGGIHVRVILQNHYGFKDIGREIHHMYATFFDDHVNLNEDTDSHTIRKMGKFRYYRLHQDVGAMLDHKFTFTFVRDPYTKLFSAYRYLKSCIRQGKIRKTREDPNYFVNFKTFVENRDKVNNISFFHAFISQFDQLIDIDGIIKTNFIGKTENLDSDLIRVLSILESPILHDNSNIPLNQSPKDEDIASEYDEERLHFVNTHFSRDFQVFGYKMYTTISSFREYYRHKNINREIDNDVQISPRKCPRCGFETWSLYTNQVHVDSHVV